MKLRSYLLSLYAFWASLFRHGSKPQISGDIKAVMPGMRSHHSPVRAKIPFGFIRRRLRVGRQKFYYFVSVVS